MNRRDYERRARRDMARRDRERRRDYARRDRANRQDYGRGNDYDRRRDYRNYEYDMYSDYPMNDGRNPYGSEGGYVTSRRDRNYDDYARRDYNDYPRRRDYDDDDEAEKLDQDELEDWYHELKEEIPEQYKSMYSMEKIEDTARQMQIDFKKFSPLELATTATMLATDYPKSVGYADINKMVAMAKEWLCDPDSQLKYGEKLSSYYDNVVNG